MGAAAAAAAAEGGLRWAVLAEVRNICSLRILSRIAARFSTPDSGLATSWSGSAFGGAVWMAVAVAAAAAATSATGGSE